MAAVSVSAACTACSLSGPCQFGRCSSYASPCTVKCTRGVCADGSSCGAAAAGHSGSVLRLVLLPTLGSGNWHSLLTCGVSPRVTCPASLCVSPVSPVLHTRGPAGGRDPVLVHVPRGTPGPVCCCASPWGPLVLFCCVFGDTVKSGTSSCFLIGLSQVLPEPTAR